MRILYVTRSLEGGGTERVIAPIFKVLFELGCEVQLVALSPKTGKILPDLEKNNIKPWILSPKDRSSLFYSFALAKILDSYQPDMIWSGTDQGIFVAQLAGWRAGIKVLSFKHLNITYPENRLAEYLCRNLSRIWVCCEQTSARYMAEKVCVPPEKIMIWNMYQTVFKPLKKWCAFEGRKLRIGSLGWASKIKNYSALIEALFLLKQKYPDLAEKLSVAIHGEAEKENAALQALIEKYGLGNTVTLGPYLQETEPFLASLDLYIQPSLNESLGIGVHDAMSLGVPAIVSNRGSMGLDTKHLENGYLLPAPTPLEIAKAIDFFLQHPQKLPEFGEKIQKFVMEKYRPEAFFAAGKNVLERCRAVLKAR